MNSLLVKVLLNATAAGFAIFTIVFFKLYTIAWAIVSIVRGRFVDYFGTEMNLAYDIIWWVALIGGVAAFISIILATFKKN